MSFKLQLHIPSRRAVHLGSDVSVQDVLDVLPRSQVQAFHIRGW